MTKRSPQVVPDRLDCTLPEADFLSDSLFRPFAVASSGAEEKNPADSAADVLPERTYEDLVSMRASRRPR